MTIKRQRVNAGALVEVEADSTDNVDTNGFSDSIQTVGAETAQFSDTSTMEANTGLRIGLTQLKINTGSAVFTPRTRTIESSLNAINPANAITPSGFCGLDEIPSNVVANFTSDATAELHVRAGFTGGGGASASILVEISDDNVTYSSVSNIVLTSTTTDYNLGAQTWQYVRVSLSAEVDSIAQINEIFEEADPNATVTVRVRSSVTINTANGDVLITDQVMNENEILTFDTELLLTGNSQFVTLEIVSLTSLNIPVTLSEITSIQEV